MKRHMNSSFHQQSSRRSELHEALLNILLGRNVCCNCHRRSKANSPLPNSRFWASTICDRYCLYTLERRSDLMFWIVVTQPAPAWQAVWYNRSSSPADERIFAHSSVEISAGFATIIEEARLRGNYVFRREITLCARCITPWNKRIWAGLDWLWDWYPSACPVKSGTSQLRISQHFEFDIQMSKTFIRWC